MIGPVAVVAATVVNAVAVIGAGAAVYFVPFYPERCLAVAFGVGVLVSVTARWPVQTARIEVHGPDADQ